MEDNTINNIRWVLLDLNKPHWHLSPTKDLSSFLRAIHHLAPPNAVIYFEAGAPDEEIKTFFKSRGIKDRPIIPMGTISPKPVFFHLPVTAQNLDDLAKIAEHHSEFEIAGHIHLYVEQTVIMQWYDAFWDPICVSSDIQEKVIKTFCQKLKLEYKKVKGV